jgi:hypothetical protein
MNFTFLNRFISMLNWILWFVPSKDATPIKQTADTFVKLEPYINDLAPKLNQIVVDLQPAIKIIVANLPAMIKLYNDLQPIIPEFQAAAKVLMVAWPEIMKAYDTAQPIIKIATQLVEVNKKNGMGHDDAVAHVKNFMQSRLDNVWR